MKAIWICVCLSVALIGTQGEAQSKKLRNSVVKKVKIEDLSHKGKYRFGYVTSPTRRGDKAQRFEIRHGDCGRSSGWNDCESDRGRVEMKERPKNAMSKPGKGIWYGYSVYIPADFVSLGRANTILSQAKVEKNNMPLWALTFNDSPYLLYSDGTHCKIGSLSSWRGRWNDIVVFANYATSGQAVYFQLFKDNKLICQRTAPIMPPSYANKQQKIGIKYGIYSSFVSRYLAKHGTMPAAAKAYQQTHSTGSSSKSPSPTPFKYDWGVKLPTHVIYYDEMRYGSRREDVDVRMLEARGVPPVD
ncbi:heparin lyase I family protein [Shimia sp. Alg240-R146]|uniref:heparin lyase I family protein n=1 Tax=Shimia sp. Alg240-R146 TaxID=2993449 RepID=UPI0022E464C4|nr:heparin lyase I family protein [Shimia sp. Alg240-R146]